MSKEEKRRGCYVMKDIKWLREKYGQDEADAIVQTKKAQQAARKPTDPVYMMDNPDLPGKEDT